MNRAQQREARQQKAEKMADMYSQGLTLEDIGRQFDITRERVRQLISLTGITRHEGGQAIRTKTVKAASISKQRQQQARQEARFGVPYELLQELRSNGATGAFTQHRQNSKRRAVEWRLTLGQWWAIWQASGKFHLRGRGKGAYCMSRIRDDGPYALGNVHIQLCTENSREAVEQWRGKDKPIKGVFCLYPGRDLAWKAAYGRVSLGFFASAEEAGAAREKYMRENGVRAGRSIGCGRGWTLQKDSKLRPYLVQVRGTKNTYHATQGEAEAEYARRCAEVLAKRAPTPEPAKVA